MKKLSMQATLALTVFCALSALAPTPATAETVNLELISASGQQVGQNYIYPYNFSVNKSPSTTPLMCLSYSAYDAFGESWTAEVESISGVKQEEAAYLFNLANTTPSDDLNAQYAAWSLFDSAALATAPDLAAMNTLLNAALAFADNSANNNFYSGFNLYVPVSGWPANDGVPQTLIGYAQPTEEVTVTPEPASLMLLCTGIFAMMALAYSNRRATLARVRL